MDFNSVSAQRRIAHLQAVLRPVDNAPLRLRPTSAHTFPESDEDIVIVSAVRTPIGKAKRGSFKDTHPTDLLAAVLRAVIERAGVKPQDIQDIAVGNVLLPGAGATQARMAMFLAGFPETVPIYTVNRQCSSGLQAFSNVAAAIRNGSIEMGIAAGVESMSGGDIASGVGELNPKIFDNELARDCLFSMGETSENVAEKFGITREKQDRMGFESQQKALAAQKAGKFDNEIVPITTIVKDANGNEQSVIVSKDEGPRATTLESLAKLRPAFKEGGTTTAGNSSQVSDGAAAVLLTKRGIAKKRGLSILGVFRSFAAVGVPPSIMGIGPAFAIPEALKRAGVTVNDIDVYEINEAFASQALYSVEKLGIPIEKVNPNGGAIALGHPLGCTGARQVATLLNELKRRGGGKGVISMCIGTGMGAAAVFSSN